MAGLISDRKAELDVKLVASKLAYVRSQAIYVTERCDGCGMLLNQSYRYTLFGRPEVFCSALCRDSRFFADQNEAKKHSTPGKCVYCGALLKDKRRGSIYCEEKCRKAFGRRGPMKRNTGASKIADTDLFKSGTYRDADRQVRQCTVPERSTPLRGT